MHTAAQKRAWKKIQNASKATRRKWARKAALTRAKNALLACRTDCSGAVEGLSMPEVMTANLTQRKTAYIATSRSIHEAKEIIDSLAANGCSRALNPELLEWSSLNEGANMLPMESNPRPKTKRNLRRKGKKACIKRCRAKAKIKRGKKLLSWKGAVSRYGVKGAVSYRRKFGVKRKNGGSRRKR